MEIKEIISSQIELMTELSSMLDLEKDVLIKDNAAELQNIIDSKKQIAQRIAAVERDRQTNYGKKTASELAKEGLIEKDKVDYLIQLVETIKQKNETNRVLTKQSINYIKMIRYALNPSQKVVIYGNNGRVDDIKATSVFNAKV